MKIALFHELPMGGARVAANNFAKFLKKEHQVDLYTVSNISNEEEHKYYSDVKFFKFLWHGLNKKSWLDRIKNDSTDLLKLFLLHKKIAEQINKQGYDVAFVHGSMFTQAPFILRFLKPEKIYYCQETLRRVYEEGYVFSENVNFIKSSYEKVNRQLRKTIDILNIKKADLILTNSEFTKKLITKNYKLESKIVYMGIDASFFRPLSIEKDIDLFFIGTKDMTNGYELLEEALHILKKRKIKVELLSGKWISDEELLKMYNRSKMVVNIEYNQPFGLIVLEGMACKIPVIALNDAAYKETVINGVNGFLVGNAKELADKISLILDNPVLAKQIGEEGRKSIENKWDWNIRITELNKVLKNF